MRYDNQVGYDNRHGVPVYEFVKGMECNEDTLSALIDHIYQKYDYFQMKKFFIREWWYNNHGYTKDDAPIEVWAPIEYKLSKLVLTGRKPVNTYYILTKSDYDKMLSSDISERQKIFIELYGTTGMRCGEGASLKWGDAQFEKSDKVQFRRKAFKTGIDVYFDINKDLLNRIKYIFNSKLFLLETSNHREYHNAYISNQIKRVGKKVLGKDISAHSLRRYFASSKLEEGMEYYKVAELLGHKSKVNFMQWYHKPIDNDL